MVDVSEFIKFNDLITKNNPEYNPYYFPLNPNSKDPIEGISWKKNRLTFEQAKEKLSKGFNIGIAATDKDKLVIMDKDDLEKVGQSKPTLTTTSRKRIGRHCFYFSDDKLSNNIFDNSAKQNIATEDYGEIRANWQYVVCAGSYVPVTDEELQKISPEDRVNAGKYSVSEELPVNSITYEELPRVYKDCLQEKRANEIKAKIENNTRSTHKNNTGCKSKLFELTIEDVTGKTEDKSKRFASMFHGSDTGKNTSISKGLLHCWRHNVSHTPLTALAVIAGVDSCSNVGYGHNGSGTSSLDFKDKATIIKLWEYAKKEGIIPEDDPQPFSVLKTNGYFNTDWLDDEYHTTDLGNAQRLRDAFKEEIRYCYPYKSWLVWDGTRWNTDNTAKMESKARVIIKDLFQDAISETDDDKRKRKLKHAFGTESSKGITNMLKVAQSESGLPIMPNEFDTDKMVFNVQNGTIDLKTGILRQHKKEDFITKISPVVYDAAAKCPTWEKFLDTIFSGNRNIIEYLQRKSGYILTGETSEEEIDEMYGGGGNGKSKFTGEIIHIMGDYHKKINVETIQAAASARDGSAASSDVASLQGARLVTVSEPEKGTILNEQRVKDWTGRDPITARQLYEKPFTFYPEFKLWIYTNHKLRIKGQDNGIWRRVKLVPFEVTIPEDEQDKTLDKKLKEESSGILNWMIEGCLKWQKDGLKVPDEILEATKEYKEEQDYLGDFFRECCEIGKNYKVPFKWLFLTYRAYCELMDMPAQSHVTFSDTLSDKRLKVKHTDKGNIYEGIRLKVFIEEKCHEINTQPGGFQTEGMKVMKGFLETFVNRFSYGDFTEKPSDTSEPSVVKPLVIENATENVIASRKDIRDEQKNSLLDFGVRAKDWMAMNGQTITSQNKVAVSMWIAETTHYNPSEIMKYLEKEYKLTPEV